MLRIGHQVSLLLLALTLSCSLALTWDEERLQWLVVTPPNAKDVTLKCVSEYIYPFYWLNDTSQIGAEDSMVKNVWWVLPNESWANETYNDGNRQARDRGAQLHIQEVKEEVHGLYHCAVEAITQLNETHYNYSSTTVYYYKRGLNLYGADLYGDNTWEKYKRNTLIGSLYAGTFLLLVACYALLDRLGVLAKCNGSNNAVDTLPDTVEIGQSTAKFEKATERNAATATETSPPASMVTTSRASVRSRRSDKVAPVETEAETTA